MEPGVIAVLIFIFVVIALVFAVIFLTPDEEAEKRKKLEEEKKKKEEARKKAREDVPPQGTNAYHVYRLKHHRETMTSLRTIADNLAMHPEDEKYRKLASAQPMFERIITRHKHAVALLAQLGFEQDGDFLVAKTLDFHKVDEVRSLLDAAAVRYAPAEAEAEAVPRKAGAETLSRRPGVQRRQPDGGSPQEEALLSP